MTVLNFPLNLEDVTNETLKAHFNYTFNRYTNFFKKVLKTNLKPTTEGSTKLTRGADRAYYIRAEKLRHPLIFYFGHTAVFYLNKLITAQILQESDRIDPWLESICAVGVDEMSWDDKLLDIDAVSSSKEEDNKIGTNAWPSVDRIRKYRGLIQDMINKIIDNFDLSTYNPKEAHRHPVWAILMGIEHENIHFTTSCPIIRQLPLECVNQVDEFQIAPFKHKLDSQDQLEVWKEHQGGKLIVGAPWSGFPKYLDDSGKYYQWDIEIGKKEVVVKPFSVRKYSITNAEYLEFVESGEYKNSEHWTEDSENWNLKHAHPKWWLFDENSNSWKLRLIDRVIDLVPYWPVEVNHHEAIAYINWYNKKNNKNCRLFTENEYYSLIQNENVPLTKMVENSNTNLKYLSPSPVDMFEGKSGICDLLGNVFSHSLTAQYPFDNYSVHPYYEDFSFPFLDDRHTFMKGSCFTSTGVEIIPASRYAYRRHFYQFCGFRLVVGETPEKIKTCPYEKNEKISKILHSHYTLNVENSPFNAPNFYETISKRIISTLEKDGKLMNEMRALDLGCSVGRLTFELAKSFKFVVGIDLINLIQYAHQIRNTNKLSYILRDGELECIHDVKYKADQLQNTQFIQFEYSNIPKTHIDASGKSMDLSRFHVISCINLLERVREPMKVLKQIEQLQQKGDYLFLSSSFTWDENVTKKENWIEVKYINAEKMRPLAILKKTLSSYELIGNEELSLIQRCSNRKFDLFNCRFTMWRKIE